MEIAVHNSTTKLNVNPLVFDYAYNEGLIHQSVVTFMNNARSGNSAQKTRAEVRGGGKKPWKQKGTGRARAGTIRSPLWRSGGVTFASKKRDYSQKLNKKMYRKAMCSILSELIRRDALIIIEDLKLKTHKTKEFNNAMHKLGVENALIIMKDLSEEAYLGSRNLIDFTVTDTNAIDPVILLAFTKVVITEDALRQIEEQLQ
ncbi:MAG: 50S ribosomal protein L4 [Legionellales bacterium RIFCSPHIGHO2_12_FULL_37_14]|nr:MAG: 50S ribosomal protein L4 [Legionellales bacterium RIFCSPHIGHO2_12_FULL_37_14]